MESSQVTLTHYPEGFEQFQYQYQMLLDQVSLELSCQEESADVSFFPCPDARFADVVAVAVCFHTKQWVIGRLASDPAKIWGVAESSQKTPARFSYLKDAISNLTQRIQHLLLSEAEQLHAEWENARIQAEIAALTHSRQFQWPDGVTLPLYEWSWINYLGADGEEDKSTRWSLVDCADERGYVPFIPEGFKEKQAPDLLKLDDVTAVIRRVEVACLEDVPDRALVSRSFTVAGVTRHANGKGQYAYSPGGETVIHYNQAHPIIQNAAATLQAQQQATIDGNGLEPAR